MGMPAVANDWTAEMVRALPDDGIRYEVVDGELLVTPAPQLPHQSVVGELFARVREYLRSQKVAYQFLSPADVELDPRTLVQPDLFVVPTAERKPRSWTEMGDLLLAVEVLSPGTARYDRQVKRRRYQRAGIPEYWIVDPDARLFERWRPGDERPEILLTEIAWQPPGATAPLSIDIAELFREALD